MSAVTPAARPSVLSVNVGLPRSITWRGRLVTSAIWKEPVEGPVRLHGVNADGDDQADRRVHGGPDKAVYAYASEDYLWWSAQRTPITAGTFGENLTTSGLDLNECRIGDRWHVGDATLEVAQPRSPCFKLGIRMDDDAFPGVFEAANRPGVYLRIVVPGTVESGAAIEVEATRGPAVRIGDLAGADTSDDVLRLAANDARVPEGWRRAAQRALGARRG